MNEDELVPVRIKMHPDAYRLLRQLVQIHESSDEGPANSADVIAQAVEILFWVNQQLGDRRKIQAARGGWTWGLTFTREYRKRARKWFNR